MVVLGRRAIHDLPTAAIALLTILVISRWKIPEPIVIGVAAVAGVVLHG